MTTNSVRTLGDIVNRIGDSYRSDAEVAAIVARLLNSGRARLGGKRAGKRIVVRPSLDSFLHWGRCKDAGRVNEEKGRCRQVKNN